MSLEDFWREYPQLKSVSLSAKRRKCVEGNFYYDFEDAYFYYKLAGKTRKMVHRFPKGFEAMANRKLFEKTPSEKGFYPLLK